MRMRPMHGKKPKKEDTIASLKFILSYISKYYKVHFVIVTVCILISSLANVRGTLFLQSLIDDYIVPVIGQKNPDMSGLLHALMQLACIYGIGVISAYSYNRLMINVAQGTLRRIRTDMFDHLQSLPIRYFDRHSHGELMSRFTNDTDTLRMMLGQMIPQVINSAVTIVSVFISMVILSIPLTCITIIMVTLMITISKKIGSQSSKFFNSQQADLGKLNGYIEEMMDGQKVVKVFNYEKKSKQEFDTLNNNLCSSATNANSFANFMGPVSNNLGHLTYSVTAICGAIFAINGISNLTVGKIASFLQLTRSFNMPISQITQQFNNVIMALAGAKRILDLMDQVPEKDEGYVELVNATIDEQGNIHESSTRTGIWAWKHPHQDGTITYTKLTGDVRFTDVDFGYFDDKIVLHDVSLFAKSGQKIAFVGATGAGKTTITNLINRFYDIQEGKIHYDGINITKIKKDDLRRSLGMVLQDTHLFTGTIKDNIRYGKLDATDEEIIQAAKIANADSFIQHLPDGYDTMLTADGAGLSQGQRQLLSIARAAVADPPVLILDEATSSIDTRTESLIQTAMDQLMEGRTVFVIAHRLSTVRNSDAIMVLDHGHIIERGSHDELIKQKGRYYQLYTGAFELD